MEELNEQEIYKRCVESWGETAQLDQCVEECAELIKAINKWKRGKATVLDLLTEMVDVHVMLEQLRYIVNEPEFWNSIKQEKLARVVRLLNGEEE